MLHCSKLISKPIPDSFCGREEPATQKACQAADNRGRQHNRARWQSECRCNPATAGQEPSGILFKGVYGFGLRGLAIIAPATTAGMTPMMYVEVCIGVRH